MMITLKNVTKEYNKGNIGLEDVSLDIAKGEFVFIVGKSGSGKTTLMKLLQKELDVTSGQIIVNGQDYKKLTQRNLPKFRRQMGMVFQDFRLLKDRTIFENVAFAQQVVEVPHRYIKRQVENMLEMVGLKDRMNAFPNELSGGEQQRVAIARALVNHPVLLLADEPTGNLDPVTAKEIMELLSEINKSGTTVLVVTHNKELVNEMLAFADNYDAPENVEAVLRWDVSDIFYNYFFVGNYMVVGGECGDDETAVDINNEAVKQCLEVYQNLNQFFYIESDSVSYDSVVQDFIDGKIVFTIATTDVLAKLKQAKEEGTFPYEYGIAMLPGPGAELQAKSLSVTNCVVVNGYSEHRELANEFAAFLTNEYYDNLYERTGKVSANLAANAGNEDLQVFMEEYKHAGSLPKMIETSNFWIQLEILFSKVWEGEDAAGLLQELSDKITTQLQ